MIPNPDSYPEFYESLPTKRLLAFVVDVVIIGAVTFIIGIMTLGLAFFVFMGVYAIVSFIYRWATLSSGSATWGMRVMSMELRQGNGSPLDGATAFMHTVGTIIAFAVFPLQLISIGLMLMSQRKQGLVDHILGTVPLNRRLLTA